MKILDLGCGPIKFKGKKGDKVVGVDWHDTYKPDVVWDLNKKPYPFKDNSYDKITSLEVIEHLDNPKNLIDESFRILKRGGVLFLTTNNKKSLINRLFHSYETSSHHSLFDISTLSRLIGARFKIEKLYCLPYDKIYHAHEKRWKNYRAAPVRKIMHHLLPTSLQERIVIIAKKP